MKRAYLIKLRYLKKVASSDGTTSMGLDGYASKYWLGIGVTDLDTESVQEIFMQAASVFNRCGCVCYNKGCLCESKDKGVPRYCACRGCAKGLSRDVNSPPPPPPPPDTTRCATFEIPK